MPDFYYIDLYFDPGDKGLDEVVEGCVSALLKAGCRFVRTTFREPPDTGLPPYFTEGAQLTPENLAREARAYTEDRLKGGMKFVSFPPWGRVVFEYDFRFDSDVLEELHMEEEDTRSSARDLGLNFLLSAPPGGEKRIKATLNLWQEYVLTRGGDGANGQNMKSLMGMVEGICAAAGPYFGAMNNELRLNADRSLDLLMKGSLPSGNDFAIVGEKLMGRLDMKGLKRSGHHWKALPGGGVIIGFRGEK